MDKQTKDRFAELMQIEPSAVSEQYWLKVIATLLFWYMRNGR